MVGQSHDHGFGSSTDVRVVFELIRRIVAQGQPTPTLGILVDDNRQLDITATGNRWQMQLFCHCSASNDAQFQFFQPSHLFSYIIFPKWLALGIQA